MSNFKVLSINPKTKSPELMLFATREEAESHEHRAKHDGRLLVTIVETRAEHEAWREKANELIRQLEGTA